MFNVPCFPEEIDTHGDVEIKALAKHFNFSEERAVEKWRLLKATITATPSLHEKRADQLMKYVCQLEASHPVLYKLAAVGFLLPTSTADCERGFSTLKRVKTTHRNSISNKVLNALLAITMDGPSISEFDFLGAVETWYGEKIRRSSL